MSYCTQKIISRINYLYLHATTEMATTASASFKSVIDEYLRRGLYADIPKKTEDIHKLFQNLYSLTGGDQNLFYKQNPRAFFYITKELLPLFTDKKTRAVNQTALKAAFKLEALTPATVIDILSKQYIGTAGYRMVGSRVSEILGSPDTELSAEMKKLVATTFLNGAGNDNTPSLQYIQSEIITAAMDKASDAAHTQHIEALYDHICQLHRALDESSSFYKRLNKTLNAIGTPTDPSINIGKKIKLIYAVKDVLMKFDEEEKRLVIPLERHNPSPAFQVYIDAFKEYSLFQSTEDIIKAGNAYAYKKGFITTSETQLVQPVTDAISQPADDSLTGKYYAIHKKISNIRVGTTKHSDVKAIITQINGLSTDEEQEIKANLAHVLQAKLVKVFSMKPMTETATHTSSHTDVANEVLQHKHFENLLNADIAPLLPKADTDAFEELKETLAQLRATANQKKDSSFMDRVHALLKGTSITTESSFFDVIDAIKTMQKNITDGKTDARTWFNSGSNRFNRFTETITHFDLSDVSSNMPLLGYRMKHLNTRLDEETNKKPRNHVASVISSSPITTSGDIELREFPNPD